MIEERIGTGGFGEVFRAKHPVIGRVVAIKVLHARYSHDPDAVARFVDEARAVNRISHPGIIEIFDFGRIDGREYCVMELVDGRSLDAILGERGRLPLDEALPILRGIAQAVDAAHAAGVAHRDLKPENVFVTSNGRTKLIDFGLAKLTRESEAVTETGSIFGTPLYMSPEQCRGRGVDTRTDLYSFGVLAYHVLVGEPPFGGDPIELALHHLNDLPEPPSRKLPELPKKVDRVLLALLAKDPAERPLSLVAAVAALEGSATLRVKWSRRSKRLLLALVPLAALAAGVAVVARRDSPAACEDKISAIWPGKRDALVARFANEPAALQRMTRAFDEVAARWSAQWHAACRADRDADPLLYSQRIACLDKLLLDLRNDVAAVGLYDLAQFREALFDGMGTGTAGRSLTDCADPSVLRAQVRPPPAAVREQVVAKQLVVQQTLTDAYVAFAHRDLPAIDRYAAELDTLARELEALDPPSAGYAILMRVDLQFNTAWDKDVRRLAAVRSELDDAVRRLDAAHDDIGLAQAHISIAQLAVGGPSLDDAAMQLERAQQTTARAGNPIRAVLALANLRAHLCLRRGGFDEATVWYRKALAIARSERLDTRELQMLLAMALARGEHLAEAIAEAESAVAEAERALGADHPAVPRYYLSMVLQVAGDLPHALEQQRIGAEAFLRTRDAGPERNPWGSVYRLDLELRLHQADDKHAVEAIKAIANLGTTPPLQNPDGPATVRRAGLYAAFEFAANRTDVTGELEHLDHAATIAFHRDDLVTAKQLAAQVAAQCAQASACTTWMPFARWIAALDAKDVDHELAVLGARYDNSPAASAYSGIILAQRGEWTKALAMLERARDVPFVWEYQADLADLATWLGLARLHAANITGARVSLEEALAVISISYDGFDGFSYTTPIAQLAMADILWDAKEPDRAIALASRAKAGFSRLHRDRDVERAAAWLAAHAR